MRAFLLTVAVLLWPQIVSADVLRRAPSGGMTLRHQKISVRIPPSVQLRIETRLAANDRRSAPLTRIPSGPLLRPPTIATLRDSDTPQVPWFWAALRARVYSHMPQMQQRDFSMTLAPVVVTGTDDTVPGLGVSGDF